MIAPLCFADRPGGEAPGRPIGGCVEISRGQTIRPRAPHVSTGSVPASNRQGRDLIALGVVQPHAFAHALIAAQGYAAGSNGPTIRKHSRYARSVGAASSLRADMISRKDG